MTYQDALKLIPEVSNVEHAGQQYLFAGLHEHWHLLHTFNLLVYDQPPTRHTSSLRIDECKIVPLGPITVEAKWQYYLDNAGYDLSKMSELQHKEMKHAFFGGAGIILLSLQEEIGVLEPQEQIETLESMKNEVVEFWEATTTSKE